MQEIATGDGAMGAHVAVPASGSGPGMVLIHEIFGNDDAGMNLGMAAAQALDGELALADTLTALAALRELPEVAGGRAGIIGFCLGGSMAWRVAAADDPDVAVVYYGSAVPGALDLADDVICPMVMHWGGADPFIPREGIDAVAAMAAERENIECHIHEGAGHAFDNHHSERFSAPAAAAAAWELTAAFLARELPTG